LSILLLANFNRKVTPYYSYFDSSDIIKVCNTEFLSNTNIYKKLILFSRNIKKDDCVIIEMSSSYIYQFWYDFKCCEIGNTKNDIYLLKNDKYKKIEEKNPNAFEHNLIFNYYKNFKDHFISNFYYNMAIKSKIAIELSAFLYDIGVLYFIINYDEICDSVQIENIELEKQYRRYTELVKNDNNIIKGLYDLDTEEDNSKIFSVLNNRILNEKGHE